MIENNRKLSGSCIVIKDEKVLLVRHTYGAVKGKYLIPGGFAEIGELPEKAAEREVCEETSVIVKAKDLVAVRFTKEEVWCIFDCDYISGEPKSDMKENDSAIFWDINEALLFDEVVKTTQVIIKSFINKSKNNLSKSDFVNVKYKNDEWQLYI